MRIEFRTVNGAIKNDIKHRRQEFILPSEYKNGSHPEQTEVLVFS